MSELYGIFCPAGSSREHREGLEGLQAALLAHHAGRVEVIESETSVLGIITHHRRDPVLAERDDGAGIGLAWLGRTTPRDDAERFGAELSRDFASAEYARLRAHTAPFCGALESPDGSWLWSDPFGLQPLYYGTCNGVLAFCSKVGPLLRGGLLPFELDAAAVLDLFTYEHVTGNRTLARDIRLLPPGTALHFDGGEPKLEAYTRLHRAPAPPPGDLVDALHEELTRAVAAALRDRPRVAVTLSGGLDSRALLGCAIEHGADVRTYTFGPTGCRDVRAAAELARRAGTPHQHLEIDGGYLRRWLDHGAEVTSGMVSCTQYHITVLADLLADEADVVLDGLAGDALSGGHLKPSMWLARSAERAADAVYRQRATAWAEPAARQRMLEPDIIAGVDHDPRQVVLEHFADPECEAPWWGCHRFDLLERQRRFVQFGPHQLRPFLDVQTPFYAAPLVARFLSAPRSQLAGQRAYLAMQARHLRDLAEVPDAARGIALTWGPGVRLGKQVVDYALRRLPGRPASSDSPTDYPAWLRGELREIVSDRLLDAPGALGGIVRRSELDRLVREHLAGSDHSARLGCLLTLDAWLRSVQSA